MPRPPTIDIEIIIISPKYFPNFPSLPYSQGRFTKEALELTKIALVFPLVVNLHLILLIQLMFQLQTLLELLSPRFHFFDSKAGGVVEIVLNQPFFLPVANPQMGPELLQHLFLRL